MKNKRGGFFKSPNDIFEIGLNTYQLSVYLYLTRCSNNSATAFPSFKTIAIKCGMSERKAKSVIKELVELRLLKKENRKNNNGGNTSNVYVPIEPDKSSAQNAQGGERGAQGYVRHAHNKELGNKEIEKKREDIYIDLPIDDHPFLDIYNFHFYEKFNKKHMRVNEEQLNLVMENIYELEGYGIGEEEFTEAVEEHFANLPERNNGNIIAFIYALFRYFEIYPTTYTDHLNEKKTKKNKKESEFAFLDKQNSTGPNYGAGSGKKPERLDFLDDM